MTRCVRAGRSSVSTGTQRPRDLKDHKKLWVLRVLRPLCRGVKTSVVVEAAREPFRPVGYHSSMITKMTLLAACARACGSAIYRASARRGARRFPPGTDRRGRTAPARVCAGSESPTVLFEASTAASSLSWTRVMPTSRRSHTPVRTIARALAGASRRGPPAASTTWWPSCAACWHRRPPAVLPCSSAIRSARFSSWSTRPGIPLTRQAWCCSIRRPSGRTWVRHAPVWSEEACRPRGSAPGSPASASCAPVSRC